MQNWPSLNWKELAIVAERLSAALRGLFVDRIVVPERPRHPGGYLKGEWILRLTGKGREVALWVSIRPRKPALALIPGRSPRAAAQATHSPFDQAVSKHLRGARIRSLEALPRERVVALRFEGGLALFVSLIPTAPEALLVQADGEAPWPVIAASRVKAPSEYAPPDGARAPADAAIREGLVGGDGGAYLAALERALAAEALESRVQAAEKLARETLKKARDRERQSRTSLEEARGEADWARFGDLLKAVLHAPPALVREKKEAYRLIEDFATGEAARVPCDPKLDPGAQVAKFYSLAKRRARRESEALARMETARERAARASSALERLAAIARAPDWAALEAAERELGIGVATPAVAGPGKGGGGKRGGWDGRAFVSRDGWAIWVGKSKDENLELTFKHARGNDLWLHVRGKPGAHVVIPVQPGKSVPLETLLDAAALVIQFSGGEKWGTTEVDYAFKKHVKRIRDSTEASYTHNKTLLVKPDPERIKRLLGGSETK